MTVGASSWVNSISQTMQLQSMEAVSEPALDVVYLSYPHVSCPSYQFSRTISNFFSGSVTEHFLTHLLDCCCRLFTGRWSEGDPETVNPTNMRQSEVRPGCNPSEDESLTITIKGCRASIAGSMVRLPQWRHDKSQFRAQVDGKE